MTDLQSWIYDLIKDTTDVYFEEAPQNKEAPYAVYNLITSNDFFERQDFIMEVDVYHDIGNVDTLADSIDAILNRAINYFGSFHARIYRINRIAIPDDLFCRRQLRYEIRVYKGD